MTGKFAQKTLLVLKTLSFHELNHCLELKWLNEHSILNAPTTYYMPLGVSNLKVVLLHSEKRGD